MALQVEPSAEIAVSCSGLEGDLRYGEIPHRLFGERSTSNANFLHFVAAFSGARPPTVLLDVNRDRVLRCDETIPVMAHPVDAGAYFRSVTVRWNDGGPRDRSQRYRLTLPGSLEESRNHYVIDIVDVPVARWTVDGQTSRWLLLDGNFNGLFDRALGDGVLVDPSGGGVIDVAPDGGNFFSYHLPLELPWGTFDVADVDPDGRFLTLVPSVLDTRVFRIGDIVPPLECHTPNGEAVRIVGASGLHQLVYFWISDCGACHADVRELVPFLHKLGSDIVTAVGISFDERFEDFSSFVETTAMSWPQCFVGHAYWDNPIARQFEIRNPSGFVLLDPDGKLVAKGKGFRELKERLLARIAVGE